MTDPLTLLEDSDPVEHLRDELDLDAPPPAAVMARIVQGTAAQAPRRSRRPVVAISLAACAAIAVAVAVLSPSGSVDPAARAYAATAPGDHVLFVDVSTTGVMTGPYRNTQHSHDQIWQHGDRAHRITTVLEDAPRKAPGTQRFVYEFVKVGDVLRNRTPEGEIQTTRASDSEEARDILQMESNFVAAFRRRYADRKLRDAGETTFEGRPARAYVVTDPEPGSSQTFYIDPETGEPLGSVNVFDLYDTKIGPDHKPVPALGPKIGEARYTEVVNRLERLPLTQENLAKLTAPWATR